MTTPVKSSPDPSTKFVRPDILEMFESYVLDPSTVVALLPSMEESKVQVPDALKAKRAAQLGKAPIIVAKGANVIFPIGGIITVKPTGPDDSRAVLKIGDDYYVILDQYEIAFIREPSKIEIEDAMIKWSSPLQIAKEIAKA